MQWYDPLNKFMLLKSCDWPAALSPNGGGLNPAIPHDPSKNSVFELVITPELEYPIICVGVRKNYQGGLKLDLINTNSSKYYYGLKFDLILIGIFLITGSSWFNPDESEQDGTATMVPRRELVNSIKVYQVCFIIYLMIEHRYYIVFFCSDGQRRHSGLLQ